MPVAPSSPTSHRDDAGLPRGPQMYRAETHMQIVPWPKCVRDVNHDIFHPADCERTQTEGAQIRDSFIPCELRLSDSGSTQADEKIAWL